VCVRGEKAALADQQGDEDLVVGRDLAQSLGNVVVAGLVEGVELLGVVDGDDGQAALVLDADGGRHGGGRLLCSENVSARVKRESLCVTQMSRHDQGMNDSLALKRKTRKSESMKDLYTQRVKNALGCCLSDNEIHILDLGSPHD
jgi:hypothetical protein